MEEPDCIYDEVRQLVAVSPEKSQYDAKERVLFVFNKPLLADGGPYQVEFKGESHCFRVPALLLNSCTLQAHAPVYYPPEKTTVTLYDKNKHYDPFIADCSFEFVSRSKVLQDLLEKVTDPEELLCSSFGISTADIKQFDEAMAQKIKRKSPHDFHLLDATFPEKVNDQADSTYPTMIHFAAAYGLAQTIAAFVQYCPTASRALALKNKDGLRPKEIAEENGHSELSEELRDFESKKRNKDRIESKDETLCNDIENEDLYMRMDSTDLTIHESEDEDVYDSVEKNIEITKHEIPVTPEMWKAIFIAEQAVNESWRNHNLSEETAKTFSQFIQKCARQNGVNSSTILDETSRRESTPTLPPKTYPMNKKRHSIHDIPDSAPPLPPRSPVSPRSSLFFSGLVNERRGSDPNIFHRMQFNFDTVSEEGPDKPPQPPARSRSPFFPRGMESSWSGSDPNISLRRPHFDDKGGSFHETKKSLTLPPKPSQVMNGAKRQPVSPNNLNCQDSSSLEVTSVGSPRLPPRKPRPFPRRQRAASCDPAIPSYFDCTQRTVSVPDEYGYVTVMEK